MNGCGNYLERATISEGFWSQVRETARREGIPYQWNALNDRLPDTEPSYSMQNFRVAAGRAQGKHAGCVFQDSDVAKWLEGVAFSLAWNPDPELEATIDGAIDDIVSAQQPDGYLDTYYIINGLDKRWTNLRDNHELYCAGHMLEAAIAYYNVTGKRKLLDAMLRYVDYIDSVFGTEPGKMQGYPGHPVLEMALMRLYDVTHNPMHLKLAKYFVDQRGQSPLYFEEEGKRNGTKYHWMDSEFKYQYYQAGRPLREQTDAEGHSVRAMYMYSGMADVARETGDAELKAACERLWDSTVHRRMYITGAIGSSEYGEAFTFDYDMPNDTVYGETCASIGLMFFARRMLRFDAKGEYGDVMERALYNGVISGMQLNGKRFFYVNPLEVVPEACEKNHNFHHVKAERQKWFGCSCCPPNIIRLLMSLNEYIYSTNEDTLFTHLYISGHADAELNGAKIGMDTVTNYPWDGKVKLILSLDKPATFKLALRIPDWCRKFSLGISDDFCAYEFVDGYVYISREWHDGDVVELNMEMPVTICRANPKVRADAGKVAVTRGPLVYCLEEIDNGADLHLVRMGNTTPDDFSIKDGEGVLNGMKVLTSTGVRESVTSWDSLSLYEACSAPETASAALTWIPYFAWANRGVGEMCVWVRA